VKWLPYFASGGLLVSLIPFVGNHYGPKFAGLIVLFPIVTLVGFSFLGLDNGRSAVVIGAANAIRNLPTALAFLATVYTTARKGLPLAACMTIGILAWLITALILSRLPK